MPEFTDNQKNVINYEGQKLLVSASAGTGKTTVMIERIATLISKGADVSSLVVVTFTNIAAAEMKKRLMDKLSQYRNDRRILEQLELLDNAAISTLHSFCGDLLRSYFYVVDIDPTFTILDEGTVNNLRDTALDDVFKEYYKAKDKDFLRVHKIFSKYRMEEEFKKTLDKLYGFVRCLENYEQWYDQTKQNFFRNNGTVLSLVRDEVQHYAAHFCKAFESLATQATQLGMEPFAPACVKNSNIFRLPAGDLSQTVFRQITSSLEKLPDRKKKLDVDKDVAEHFRSQFDGVYTEATSWQKEYVKLSDRTLDELWDDTEAAVNITDKVVEILNRFHQKFSALKRQRGGLDFGDMEHLALKVLDDPEALKAIHDRYKLVFVDEYQDTNPVQEAIISKLAQGAQLFMVGDIKQSIYGFRGCEPTIFLDKYQTFKQTGEGHVEELNENFRSNEKILQFVNRVFDLVMTPEFGQVDYAKTARLQGKTERQLSVPAVQIDLLVEPNVKDEDPVDDVYDISASDSLQETNLQGERIVQKINEYLGLPYVDKDGNAKQIEYEDIVILTRSRNEKMVELYNSLIEHNIPVVADFKSEGYVNKEVREVISLLRVLDNPYNDVYLVGTCLSVFGGLTEKDLAEIKIFANAKDLSFYERMQIYVTQGTNQEIKDKIDTLIAFLDNLRFFAHSATVDQIIMRALEQKDFRLYVQGFPNGNLRLTKLHSFIEGLKGASFSQSVSKFLFYLDDAEDKHEEEVGAASNAVRLMTMHASKGAEFPIVFLASLEKGTQKDADDVVCNSRLGLATPMYDFRRRHKRETLGTKACEIVNEKKTNEEESRLLYVAMTRAKQVLHLVAAVSEKQLTSPPKIPAKATTLVDWILLALKKNYPNLTIGVTTADFVVNVVRSVPQQTVNKRNLLCPQISDADAVLKPLQYSYPFADQTQMPSKVVSSALDREYVVLDDSRDDAVLAQDNDRHFVGTAYHKVYQYADFNSTKEQIAQVIQGLVNEGQIESCYASQLDVDLIFSTMNNPLLRKILSQGKVYHEQPFMLLAPYDKLAADKRFSDDVMLQGVIDLLVIGENRATVVDFKYSTHSVEHLKKSYTAQLNSYRLAVQTICGIKDVDCYILSIADNKLVKM